MTNNERGSSTMGLIGRRPLLTSIFAGILALAISGTGRLLWKAYGGRSIKWAAFYGVEANEDLLGSYELVILDPEYRGSIKAISERGTRICAYLSLAEIRTANPYFAGLDKAAVIGENPDWPGTLRVDVRHPAWKKLLLDEQIPHAIARGFSGVMFDTVDTPPYLEQINPKAHKGMRDAAIDLIASVRNRYPGLELIGNRGYMMLPDIVGMLDAVIAESLISMPRKDGSGYTWVPEKDVEAQLAFIRKAKRVKPDLPILSLDYWSPDDIATIAQIYRRERAMGHHPYVSTHSLDRIVAEPPQA